MNKRIVLSALGAAALAVASSTQASVIRDGHTFTDANNNTITAVQGIDANDPFGQNSANALVNEEFEGNFDGLGVTYDTGSAGKKGGLQDFGVGLYGGTKNGPGLSTGLMVNFAGGAQVDPNSVTITIEDFDIKSLGGGFNPGKVAPSILLLGANNTIVAKASAADFLAVMKPANNIADEWNVNLGALTKGLHTPITGYLLYADPSGFKVPSDPYTLAAAGTGMGTPVPEAANYIAGMVAIGAVLLLEVRRFRRKNAANI